MSSLVIQLADAVVTQINAGEYSEGLPTFTAERALTPVFEPKDLDDCHVSVVPRSHAMPLSDRTYVQNEITVDVAVQMKIASSPETEAPLLMQLTEEIALELRKASLADMSAATWMGGEISPSYSYEHLRDFRTFTSVLTLTYRVFTE